MLEFLVEFIGTFIFLSVILMSGNPIAIGIALVAAIYFGGKVSGGHFNPAVSLMMFLNNKINVERMGLEMLSQFLGGIAALYYYKLSK